MSGLRDKIGQMLMVGLTAEDLTPDEKTVLAEYPIGNFIFFSRNLREPDRVVSLCRTLWHLREEPPFIAIDHEGGRVHRLPEPFTHFPAASVLGGMGKPEPAYAMGAAMGRELSAAGINLNFAPVLDVLSNPENPVIGDRSLGADPRKVSRLGWEIVRGLKDSGVIPCGKHFPGHGDTEKDSHLELPVVRKNRGELDACELRPFVHACENEIDSLMTAHVLYPALDPDLPATLSRSIIGDLLRGEMAYGGVVFSDDLEMRAITDSYSAEEASALAVDAGVDVLMFCHHAENAARAFEFLCRKAEREERSRVRIEESSVRIARLKWSYLKSFTGTSGEQFRKSADLENHKKLAAAIQGSL
ncbi:MAG: beta-N-acetylhexosaminidase [Candidatus Binatia bacterium]